MADANARFRDQRWGKNVCVIECAALRVLYAGALEATTFGTACQSKHGLIVDVHERPAEADGIAITLSVIEMELGIKSSCGFENVVDCMVLRTGRRLEDVDVREQAQSLW